MTLRELEAEFYRLNADGSRQVVGTLAEADGVSFLCPVCFVDEAEKARRGCH